jgi:hypothetical protein
MILYENKNMSIILYDKGMVTNLSSIYHMIYIYIHNTSEYVAKFIVFSYKDLFTYFKLSILFSLISLLFVFSIFLDEDALKPIEDEVSDITDADTVTDRKKDDYIIYHDYNNNYNNDDDDDDNYDPPCTDDNIINTENKDLKPNDTNKENKTLYQGFMEEIVKIRSEKEEEQEEEEKSPSTTTTAINSRPSTRDSNTNIPPSVEIPNITKDPHSSKTLERLHQEVKSNRENMANVDNLDLSPVVKKAVKDKLSEEYSYLIIKRLHKVNELEAKALKSL